MFLSAVLTFVIMKISSVVIAYNEKGNADVLAKRLYNVFNKLGVDFEMIFVVQGNDGTFEDLKALPKEYNLKLFYNEKPLGIKVPFKLGFDNVSSDATHVLTMDADLNHQPEEIPLFINALKETGADIIIGSRYIKGGDMVGMPSWKKALSRSVNVFMSFFYGLKVHDKTSGYRLCKKEVVDVVKEELISRNFEYYPEFLIRAAKHNFSMVEVPILFKFRIAGKSKLKIMKNLKGYLRLIKSRFD